MSPQGKTVPPPTGTIYEASLELTGATAFAVLEALEAARPAPVAVGLTERPDGLWRVWAHYRHPPPDRRVLTQTVQPVLGEVLTGSAITIEPLPDIDWVARAQQALPPVRAGRFRVHGAHDRVRLGRCLWSIEIEAGQAFGTAHHGSTRGCLLALDHLLRRCLTGWRLLDMGTGSGVLAIAAARATRQPVLASDIDPTAVAVAHANARINGVGAQVRVVQAAGLAHRLIRRGGPYDLVMANILAGPLTGFAPAMARTVAPGGHAVLAGLTNGQANAVAAAYRLSGFLLIKRFELGEWTTLLLRRSAPRSARNGGRERPGAAAAGVRVQLGNSTWPPRRSVAMSRSLKPIERRVRSSIPRSVSSTCRWAAANCASTMRSKNRRSQLRPPPRAAGIWV